MFCVTGIMVSVIGSVIGFFESALVALAACGWFVFCFGLLLFEFCFGCCCWLLVLALGAPRL